MLNNHDLSSQEHTPLYDLENDFTENNNIPNEEISGKIEKYGQALNSFHSNIKENQEKAHQNEVSPFYVNSQTDLIKALKEETDYYQANQELSNRYRYNTSRFTIRRKRNIFQVIDNVRRSQMITIPFTSDEGNFNNYSFYLRDGQHSTNYTTASGIERIAINWNLENLQNNNTANCFETIINSINSNPVLIANPRLKELLLENPLVKNYLNLVKTIENNSRNKKERYLRGKTARIVSGDSLGQIETAEREVPSSIMEMLNDRINFNDSDQKTRNSLYAAIHKAFVKRGRNVNTMRDFLNRAISASGLSAEAIEGNLTSLAVAQKQIFDVKEKFFAGDDKNTELNKELQKKREEINEFGEIGVSMPSTIKDAATPTGRFKELQDEYKKLSRETLENKAHAPEIRTTHFKVGQNVKNWQNEAKLLVTYKQELISIGSDTEGKIKSLNEEITRMEGFATGVLEAYEKTEAYENKEVQKGTDLVGGMMATVIKTQADLKKEKRDLEAQKNDLENKSKAALQKITSLKNELETNLSKEIPNGVKLYEDQNIAIALKEILKANTEEEIINCLQKNSHQLDDAVKSTTSGIGILSENDIDAKLERMKALEKEWEIAKKQRKALTDEETTIEEKITANQSKNTKFLTHISSQITRLQAVITFALNNKIISEENIGTSLQSFLQLNSSGTLTEAGFKAYDFELNQEELEKEIKAIENKLSGKKTEIENSPKEEKLDPLQAFIKIYGQDLNETAGKSKRDAYEAAASHIIELQSEDSTKQSMQHLVGRLQAIESKGFLTKMFTKAVNNVNSYFNNELSLANSFEKTCKLHPWLFKAFKNKGLFGFLKLRTVKGDLIQSLTRSIFLGNKFSIYSQDLVDAVSTHSKDKSEQLAELVEVRTIMMHLIDRSENTSILKNAADSEIKNYHLFLHSTNEAIKSIRRNMLKTKIANESGDISEAIAKYLAEGAEIENELTENALNYANSEEGKRRLKLTYSTSNKEDYKLYYTTIKAFEANVKAGRYQKRDINRFLKDMGIPFDYNTWRNKVMSQYRTRRFFKKAGKISWALGKGLAKVAFGGARYGALGAFYATAWPLLVPAKIAQKRNEKNNPAYQNVGHSETAAAFEAKRAEIGSGDEESFSILQSASSKVLGPNRQIYPYQANTEAPKTTTNTEAPKTTTNTITPPPEPEDDGELNLEQLRRNIN